MSKLVSGRVSNVIVLTKDQNGRPLADNKKRIICVLDTAQIVDGHQCDSIMFSKGLLASMAESNFLPSAQAAGLGLKGSVISALVSWHNAKDLIPNSDVAFQKDGFSYEEIAVEFNMDKINNAATLIESTERAKSYRESLNIQPVAKTSWVDDEPKGANADINAAIDAKVAGPKVEEPAVLDLNEKE